MRCAVLICRAVLAAQSFLRLMLSHSCSVAPGSRQQCEKYLKCGGIGLCAISESFIRFLVTLICQWTRLQLCFSMTPPLLGIKCSQNLKVSLNWMSFENHMFHIATVCSCVCGGDIMSLTRVQSSVQVETLREGER